MENRMEEKERFLEDDRRNSVPRLFLFLAFLVSTFFVGYLVYQAVLERRPSMDKLLSRAEGVELEVPFEPKKHDRNLELPPWLSEDGERFVSLSEYADQTVFVNFWATTCQPCIDEIPSMMRLAEKLKGEDFVMVAISTDSSWKEIQSFFKRNLGGMPGNIVVLRDPQGETSPLMNAYGTELIPESYMIQNGMIRHRFRNKHDWTGNDKWRYFKMLLEEGKNLDD
jgi:cytochrome c biogenesis protein CcmG/thiol:disulfide interchange protein DsbE